MSITYLPQPFDLALLPDLQDNVSDNNSNSGLQRLLSASSQYILSRINRSIFNNTFTNELYDGNGNDLLTLLNYPLNAITNLQINTASLIGFPAPPYSQPQVIPASVAGTPGYVFDGTTIYLVGGYVFPVGRKNISVSYAAGYGPMATLAWVIGTTYAAGATVSYAANVYLSLQAGNVGQTPGSSPTYWRLLCPMLPMDLTQAAIELASQKFRRRGHQDQDSGSLSGQSVSFSKKDVPAEVATVIQQYNRRFQI